jgi:hypothetical protein
MSMLRRAYRRIAGSHVPTIHWWEACVIVIVILSLGIVLGIITTPYPISSQTTYTRTLIPPPQIQTSTQTVIQTPVSTAVTSVLAPQLPPPVTNIKTETITLTPEPKPPRPPTTITVTLNNNSTESVPSS